MITKTRDTVAYRISEDLFERTGAGWHLYQLTQHRAGGVHDAHGGVQRLFDGTHGGEFGGIAEPFEVGDLQATDTVFGGK